MPRLTPAAFARLGAAALVFALAACAGSKPALAPSEHSAAQVEQTVHATPALSLPRVAPADLGRALQLHQHLQISRGGERHEIDVALEIDDRQIKLAALGMGLRLISLRYDGETIGEQRHPLLPAAVSGERILRDLVLTYWPVAAIQARLPDGWTLRERNSVRELSWQGRPVMRIVYQADPPWSGSARLQHLQHDYELLIDSREA